MSKQASILMIVTSCGAISAEEATGIWLEEFALPYLAFTHEGFQVQVASIEGGKAPIDPRSKATPEQQETWQKAIEALEQTTAIATIQSTQFDAIFLPGGHGTMFDLPGNTHLQTLLREAMAQNKYIAAVCHGPAGLVEVNLDNGSPLVAGKTLTGFTNEEESAAGLSEKMPFLLETRLKELGAKFIAQDNWADHVEIDGNLITGQNPQSTQSVAQALIKSLR